MAAARERRGRALGREEQKARSLAGDKAILRRGAVEAQLAIEVLERVRVEIAVNAAERDHITPP